jgi:3-methyladenine DNA glycosylase AlkC
MFKTINKPHPTFSHYDIAMKWAKTYARDCCHAFQAWRIVREGNEFAVAIYSRNTGEQQGYAA